jgi:hypothetical protein
MENRIITERNSKYFFILLLLACALSSSAQNERDEFDECCELSREVTEPDTLQATSALSVETFRMNRTFTDSLYRDNFKLVPSKVNIYDMPYSITANYPNYKRLALNTGVLYGAGFLTLGVLCLLPEDATAWNKKEMQNTPPFKRWWRNVKKGPVVDKDNFIFNYVLHPYGGAAYYMGARSQGFNLFYSFLYGAGVSTLFWEYGIEAFMEIPSIQDLILTPFAGALIGEGFYILKRHIVANNYKLFGSPVLGNIVAFLIDPVNEVIGLFAGNPCRNNVKTKKATLAGAPWFDVHNGSTFGLTLSLTF